MKKKLLIILTVLILLTGKVDALTLTQKLGSEYIETTVEKDEVVNMKFTSKVGFQFKNWIVSGVTGIDTLDSSISFSMPNNNVTIEGKYDEEYVVTFNNNTGTGSMTNLEVPAGGSKNLTKNTFVKDGYTFKGWAETADGEVKYDDEDSIKPTANMTLYAVWGQSAVETFPIADVPVGAYIKYTPASRTVVALGDDTGTGTNQNFNTSTYDKGWKVMYNNNGQLDIISAENVINGLVIGADTNGEYIENPDATLLNKMKTGYAKAPYMLNKFCSEYAEGDFAVSGRSLMGSYEGEKNLFNYEIDGKKLTIEDISYTRVRELIDAGKISEDNGRFYPYSTSMDSDEANAEWDLVIGTEALRHTAGNVWMAYRGMNSGTGFSDFGVFYRMPDGDDDYGCLFRENSSGLCGVFGSPCGVRPVITLESGLKIIGGDGLTPNTAYVLSR